MSLPAADTLALSQRDIWYTLARFLSPQCAWAMLYICQTSRAAFMAHAANRELYLAWLVRLLETSAVTTRCSYAVLSTRRFKAIDMGNTLYTQPHYYKLAIPGFAYYLGSVDLTRYFPHDYCSGTDQPFVGFYETLVLEQPLSVLHTALYTAMIARTHSCYANAYYERMFRLFSRGIFFTVLRCRNTRSPPYYIKNCEIDDAHTVTATACYVAGIPKVFRRRCNTLIDSALK